MNAVPAREVHPEFLAWGARKRHLCELACSTLLLFWAWTAGPRLHGCKVEVIQSPMLDFFRSKWTLPVWNSSTSATSGQATQCNVPWAHQQRSTQSRSQVKTCQSLDFGLFCVSEHGVYPLNSKAIYIYTRVYIYIHNIIIITVTIIMIIIIILYIYIMWYVCMYVYIYISYDMYIYIILYIYIYIILYYIILYYIILYYMICINIYMIYIYIYILLYYISLIGNMAINQ